MELGDGNVRFYIDIIERWNEKIQVDQEVEKLQQEVEKLEHDLAQGKLFKNKSQVQANNSQMMEKKINALKNEEQNVLNELKQLEDLPDIRKSLSGRERDLDNLNKDINDLGQKIEMLRIESNHANKNYQDTLALGNKFLESILDYTKEESYFNYQNDYNSKPNSKSCNRKPSNPPTQKSDQNTTSLTIPKLKIDKIKNQFNSKPT